MEAATVHHLFPNGEVPDDLPRDYRSALAELVEARDEIAGLQAEVTSLGSKLTKARRNRAKEAHASEIWPVAERLFVIWKAATSNHNPRSRLTVDRFELVAPFLEGAELDRITYEPGPPRNALEDCAAAIIGRTTYPFTTTRENGTTKRFWEWNRIFANADEMDDSKARRPRDWRERLRELDEGPR